MVIKCLDKSNLKKDWLILAHILRVKSLTAEMAARQQELEVASRISSNQEERLYEWVVPSSSSFFFSSPRSHPHKMVPSTGMGGILPPIKEPSQDNPSQEWPEVPLPLILDLIKLTIVICHHLGFKCHHFKEVSRGHKHKPEWRIE